MSNKPKVFWWTFQDFHKYREENKENFGDIITPYLVEKLTGRVPILFDPNFILAKYIKHSIMVGSILEISNPNTIVWGTGIVDEKGIIRGGDFKAVRGFKTIKRLRSLGYKVPDIVGDPALLLPLIYRNTKSKKYKYGVVCHYVDFEEIKTIYDGNKDILIINLLTENIELVIDAILKCEKIISTSLHGIIVANAYNIEAKWWKFSDKLSGSNVKFYDYFESLGVYNVQFCESKTIDNELLSDSGFYLPEKNRINEVQKGLITSFPYKIQNKKAKEFLKI
jgi:hypothetical protein